MLAFVTGILLAICALPAASIAQGVVESIGLDASADSTSTQIIDGSIDWSNQVLTVYGEGVAPEGVTDPVRRRLMGFRAAKVEARRNLLELVGDVRVSSHTDVKMAMVSDDSVNSQVTGIVRGARVLPESQTISDGLYRIALLIDLRNEFADALLPDLPPPPLIEPDTTAAEADSALALLDEPVQDQAQVYVEPDPFTGLIVDARGLDLQPSMAPRVVDSSGYEVYHAGFADRLYATQVGVAGYEKDMDTAMMSDRLGGKFANPLIVDAVEVVGDFGADAVIGDEEAVWVRMADEEQGFLSECRVVFLVGPRPVLLDSTFVDTTQTGEDFEFQAETDSFDIEQ